MDLRTDQLETIKDATLTLCRLSRQIHGEVPPALILAHADRKGELSDATIIPLTDGTKDDWAYLHQRQARSPENAASILVLECWHKFLNPAEDLPDTIKNDAERTEVLMLNVLTRTSQHLLLCEIKDGKIQDADFNDTKNLPTGCYYTGRFVRA